jgi:hypothetical protein
MRFTILLATGFYIFTGERFVFSLIKFLSHAHKKRGNFPDIFISFPQKLKILFNFWQSKVDSAKIPYFQITLLVIRLISLQV